MVHLTLSTSKTLTLTLATGMMLMTGCTSNYKEVTPDWNRHRAIVEKTAAHKTIKPGSEVEQEALKRFEAFYADYSAEAIKSGIRDVYAHDAWFGDPFHIVEGIDELEHYFVVMAEPVEACTFKIDSMQRAESDYFMRWTMILSSKAVKGDPIETIGISHVRLNEEGKVIFQQDYWDSSAMMDRLPVVGYWTRLVKTRISKGLEQ